MLDPSVELVCHINVVKKLFVWCYWLLTPVEVSLFSVREPAFQSQTLTIVSTVG